jgi:regulation of enolase protein 1 (concanavalin A-like superfamily)
MRCRDVLTLGVTVTALAWAIGRPAAAAPPPAPWVAGDIGGPPVAGSTDVDAAGVWTLQGGGADIFWDYDQFQFARQPVRGDGSITARFLSVAGGNPTWAKTGLMIRENDTPSSPHLHLCMSRQFGLGAYWRPAQEVQTREFFALGPSNRPEANLWLRLQRAGNEVAGFYSRDGQLWTQADLSPLLLPTLGDEALFGLTVTAKDGPLATSQFDRVSVQPGLVSVYGLQALGGDRSVLLQWRPLPGALGYRVYRAAPDAPREQWARLTADAIPNTSYADTSAGLENGTPVAYVVAPVLRGADGAPAEGPPVGIVATPVAVPGLNGASIGEGPRPGLASHDAAAGKITLRGGGWGIAEGWWQSADQGYFLQQAVEGDVRVTARLLGRPTGGTYRIAGVMIRESLAGDARHLMIGVAPNAPFSGYLSGLVRRWREVAGEGSTDFLSIDMPKLPLPIMMRLTRRGNTITPEFSRDDGKTWQSARPVTFSPPLGQTLHVGLVASGGGELSSRLPVCEAQFDRLEIAKP